MTNQHLSYFKVNNFKKFKSLEVKDIGQFNLIVGDNNVGKTSFLESLLFNETNYNQFLSNFWFSLVHCRHINALNGNAVNYLDFFLDDKETPLSYQYSYLNSQVTNLSLKKVVLTELDSNSLENLKEKIIIHKGTQHLIKFTKNGLIENVFMTYGAEPSTYESYSPFIFFGLNYQQDLIQFFSEI